MTLRQKKKRKVLAEYVLRNSLANRFKNNLGEPFFADTTLIGYSGSNKRVLALCSSFNEEGSKWFWGVPEKYWIDWGPQDMLGLIMENQIHGYSFVLLSPKESKHLLGELGMDKSRNKKINMRVYQNDDIIRFEKDKRFNVEKRMKPLEITIE